jgi:hypothetical protein
MIISYEGTDYDFDTDRISVDEWRELKRKYKMTPKGFQDGLSEADPDAMTFLYVAMQRQAGRANITLGDHIKVDVIALNAAVSAAVEAGGEQEEPEGEADPTKASPSRPASSVPAQRPATLSPETEVRTAAATGF